MTSIGKKNDLTIFGIRSILEAIYSGKSISKIFLLKKPNKIQYDNSINPELRSQLLKLIKSKDIPCSFVPREKFPKNKNHQGAYAILSPINFHNLEDLIEKYYKNATYPCFLILDEITDIGNLGAILRSASCFNITGVIIPISNAAQINSDVVKTSAGAVFHIPVCRVKNIYNTIKYLKDHGLYIISLSEKTDNIINTKNFDRPLAIIIGAEDKGIKPQHLKLSDEIMKIPINGPVESLNASIATSIVCYELNKYLHC